ncbi:hypothetical protein STTU_5695 [Streptomyces sp. Tu6071]|nr:hypothetical protein STTU_5695 [Streptomyces sp. Tu6071]
MLNIMRLCRSRVTGRNAEAGRLARPDDRERAYPAVRRR